MISRRILVLLAIVGLVVAAFLLSMPNPETTSPLVAPAPTAHARNAPLSGDLSAAPTGARGARRERKATSTESVILSGQVLGPEGSLAGASVVWTSLDGVPENASVHSLDWTAIESRNLLSETGEDGRFTFDDAPHRAAEGSVLWVSKGGFVPRFSLPIQSEEGRWSVEPVRLDTSEMTRAYVVGPSGEPVSATV